MRVTSEFKRGQLASLRHRAKKVDVTTSYRARLEALGDADNVRRALLEALATLHALAGCDDPATRATARDAIRAVEEELNPKGEA